ncbi:MAG: methyltransferase domain-containing protein [Candidatus Hinthialibacter antarcticus]|nr:methyltransferase domain-containing protein [Candidatus Hinthialibacter antarcticus]
MREWAPDCRLHFSICRHCAAIFQNPPAPLGEDSFAMDSIMDTNAEQSVQANEALDWLSQFSGRGQEPFRALELYTKSSKLEEALKAKNCDVTAVSAKEFLEKDFSQNEPYDIVFCFEVLNETSDPNGIVQKAHSVLKDDGGLYVDVVNPLVLPRANQMCFTGSQRTLLTFPTLMYLTYKNGFRNMIGEVTGSARSYMKKIDVPDTVSLSEVSSKDYWSYVTYRCERNYWFSWVLRFLVNFMKSRQVDANALDTARNQLRHDPQHMQIVREACGVMLLFAQEVQTLQQSLSGDWHQTMARIFTILKDDLVLFDLLQLEPMENMGLLAPMNRFYLNEKMIYVSEAEYFKKYFTQEDAEHLCKNIFKSSQTVVGHLSSFL